MLRTSFSSDVALSILHLPLVHCGLGFLHLRHEAALHYLPGAMALCDQASSAVDILELRAQVALAVQHLQDASGINIEALHTCHAPHRRAHAVRVAFYEALAAQLLPQAPWLHPPTLVPDGPAQHQMLRFQTRVAMAPYWPPLPPSCLCLPSGSGSSLISACLSSPLPCAVSMCHWSVVAPGPPLRSCQPLRLWPSHAPSPAPLPCLARSASSLRLAGQSRARRPPSSRATKRADLVAHNPHGASIACDVQSPPCRTCSNPRDRLFMRLPSKRLVSRPPPSIAPSQVVCVFFLCSTALIRHGSILPL